MLNYSLFAITETLACIAMNYGVSIVLKF